MAEDVPLPRPRPKNAPDKFSDASPDYQQFLRTYSGVSKLAPEGLPTDTYRRSENVEDERQSNELYDKVPEVLPHYTATGDVPLAPLPMPPASVTGSPMAQSLGINDITKGLAGNAPMMLPTVPQMNPVAPFNKPSLPGMPQAGLGTNLNQQLLTLLGGLGGMPANPLAPGIARSPQPGPPTNTATQILGALGGGGA